jgi:hypothetical protein
MPLAVEELPMRENFRVDFGQKAVPAGWIEVERRYTFENGGLRSNGAAHFQFLIPGGTPREIRVELEVEAVQGASLGFGDGTMLMLVDLERPEHRILYSGQYSLASSTTRAPHRSGRSHVVFEMGSHRLRASINGKIVLDSTDPRGTPLGSLFEIGFWEDCLVFKIEIVAETSSEQANEISGAERFHTEIGMDFFDDLIAAPWDSSMLDRLFAEFEAWGIRRCHWIYYGRMSEGWWDEAPYGVANHARATFEKIGEFFPAAVKAAHLHGIEIYGLIKPFEMGQFNVLSSAGKLPYAGGRLGWVTDFAAQRRDLVMARKPGAFGPAKNAVFTKIELIKDDDGPASFSIEDVEILVSTDNESYVPYDGPVRRFDLIEDYPVWKHDTSGGRPSGTLKRSRVFRFEKLEISAPYVALAISGRSASFANDLINLLHVFGPEGEERNLTYGILPRAKDFAIGENVATVALDASFRRAGVHFDVAGGVPTSVSPGYNVLEVPFVFDSEPGFIAFARGKERSPIGALSPSFPEVRRWWLSWVKDCLDAGADGVELRVRNHHSHLTWAEYGFESPVRDSYLERFGVDIWMTDQFDKGRWRRLRGEAYTEFVRETRRLVQSKGKKLGLHISHTNSMMPETGAAMDIHWDWKTWIEEGLADTITLKDIWPGSSMAEEIASLAKSRGMAVVFCPYANNLWMRPNGEKTCEDWMKLALRCGCDGFQLYQGTAVLAASPEGEIHSKYPALREVFRRYSTREKAI